MISKNANENNGFKCRGNQQFIKKEIKISSNSNMGF